MEDYDFSDSALMGSVTVAGDGSIDFEVIVKALEGKGQEGWCVIEAEQDPVANLPFEMAKKGRNELYRVMDVSGNEVVAA